MELTNRLISHYVPFDFITRFEFNRPEFHRDRQDWSKAYADFVAMALENTYLGNRNKAFDDLYV